MGLPLAGGQTQSFSLSLSYTLIQKRNTGSQRCLETHIHTHVHTHVQTHTQRATLISCLALLSSVWHSWGDQAILWTAVNTNKHTVYSVSLTSLTHTFTTFDRQTLTSRKSLSLFISASRIQPTFISLSPLPFSSREMAFFFLGLTLQHRKLGWSETMLNRPTGKHI